jgi:mRNA interferase RelE/StbE
LASIRKTWRIEITRTAEKQIKKLDRVAQTAILRFLRERIQNVDSPRQLGRPLRGDKGGLWRYRIGDYRLICDIQEEKVTVLVLRVGIARMFIDKLRGRTVRATGTAFR